MGTPLVVRPRLFQTLGRHQLLVGRILPFLFFRFYFPEFLTFLKIVQNDAAPGRRDFRRQF